MKEFIAVYVNHFIHTCNCLCTMVLFTVCIIVSKTPSQSENVCSKELKRQYHLSYTLKWLTSWAVGLCLLLEYVELCLRQYRLCRAVGEALELGKHLKMGFYPHLFEVDF